MILDGKSTTGLVPNKSNYAAAIKVPPFFGYPLAAKSVFTFGGRKVDLASRVLSVTGESIFGERASFS
ncbi:hypothetical protein ACSS6W_005903 [Trichoderma asperelloides]